MGQTFYGPDDGTVMYGDNTILYLLALVGAAFATGFLYYRELYRNCEKQKENLKKNRFLFDDWGE